MTKEHFLLSLEKELKQQQIENFTTYINYYDEIINDYMEDGYTELEALNKLDSIDQIVQTIKDENGLIETSVVKRNPMLIVLLIIGAPLWGSILISIILLLFSGLIILWCGPFILGALSFGGLLTGIVSLAGLVFNQQLFYIVTQLGVALIATAVGILLLLDTVYSTKYVGVFSKKIINTLQKVFSWKGGIF